MDWFKVFLMTITFLSFLGLRLINNKLVEIHNVLSDTLKVILLKDDNSTSEVSLLSQLMKFAKEQEEE